ncbi:MAG: hypothetical protein AAFX56_08100 [Pseudomonadota bacterium]
MSRTSQYRKLIGQIKKPTVAVRVGRKVEELTDTQAYRFDELTQANARTPQPANDNPFEQARYSLQDAAFRLLLSEEDLLRQAASGKSVLYINAAGLRGRWQRLGGNGKPLESSERALCSGYLALAVSSCEDLALNGSTSAAALELPEHVDPARLDLDVKAVQELSAWGKQQKRFHLCEPECVRRDRIVLLAPLAGDSS